MGVHQKVPSRCPRFEGFQPSPSIEGTERRGEDRTPVVRFEESNHSVILCRLRTDSDLAELSLASTFLPPTVRSLISENGDTDKGEHRLVQDPAKAKSDGLGLARAVVLLEFQKHHRNQ